ncbi:hypothetical protein CTA2_4604 [Colletotrichum tanaceti]|uniref:Uncharacterized protein n=1 Tax=Colletotrichum tanaceti TaxID=1306861 RepID=A0A4U6XC54_9PEZI|nr:hypothetical protein CTA2_4604 [Colletotrichum tanaceti]TKW52739.1 hypothetical protein CTA1_11245 [Colletotrichum tanaceti]
MHHLTLFSVAVAAMAATAQAFGSSRWRKAPCLCDEEALDIANRWLSIFSTGGVSGKEEVATIVSRDLVSADETFGPPTFGIDAFWAAVTPPAGSPRTTTNVTQSANFFIRTCDQIAFNWQYNGVTTGFNSTVPAGTSVAFTGNDIIQVDLETRLISNATSSGQWILLAQQLGGRSCGV